MEKTLPLKLGASPKKLISSSFGQLAKARAPILGLPHIVTRFRLWQVSKAIPPNQYACEVREGDSWIAVGGQKPEGLCDSAWESMRWFVEELAAGRGNFFDGWMKNPFSAMISCNDGFRPVSFLLERCEEGY